MQLTHFKSEEWKDVASYVDTLCLPVTSIDIQDKDIQLKNSKMVQDFAEDLERNLIGRLLLLPPVINIGKNVEMFKNYLDGIIKGMEQSGFYYLVLIIDGALKSTVKEFNETDSVKIVSCFIEISEEDSQTEIEQARESLYQRVLGIWQ